MSFLKDAVASYGTEFYLVTHGQPNSCKWNVYTSMESALEYMDDPSTIIHVKANEFVEIKRVNNIIITNHKIDGGCK